MHYFTDHPRENNISYCQHMSRSLRLSFRFFVGSIGACVHSFFPFVCQTSSTDFHNDIGEILNEHNNNINSI
jgi:hypothetical protein